ncbi:GPI transamidase subunit PIG-U, partial [Kickxella alabastrina]|uniref:GPI transamidase subunit PIG-U n=1 Tax=Kickxella alabastrina TaxID=61397 RepID=UPI00221F0FE4
LLRLAILTLSPGFVANHLSSRVELSTPVTNHKRLVEGLHLAAHGISPYQGGLYHQSPLLLMLFKLPYALLPQFFSDVLYVAADVTVALLLAKMAAVPGETVFQCLPSTVALLYLFNPLTLATSLSRSSIVFSHLATISALYSAIIGLTDCAVILTAVATHLSLYPVMLIAPICLMTFHLSQRNFKQQKQTLVSSIILTLGKFILALFALHLSFAALYGAEYFSATFDFTLRVADLQPNVGLFWYFFIEIFDEFRSFFFVVFQLTALAFAVPVTWRFRNDPLFGAAMLVGVISALKSYPSWGDLRFSLGFCLSKYLQYTFLSANLLLYGVGLAPVFWYLWIEQGSGNANFFYAATLVYVFGQITLLFDLGSAMLRRELDIHHPETRLRTVVQE